jgi:thioredoxin reductase
VQTGVEVTSVNKKEDFVVGTSAGILKSQFVIWAGGESQYPNKSQFPGAELCLHYIDVHSWDSLEGDDFVIIGGYESGIDAAINLTKLGKNCVILDRDNRWEESSSDPSTILSIYTQERFREAMKTGRIMLQ